MSLGGQTRALVDETLTAFLDREVEALRNARPRLVPIADAIRTLALRGGKRLRPLVAVAGYVAAGGARPDEAARLVSGLELLQVYLLVHDDWMDGDVTRRGGPTLHVQFRAAWGDSLGDATAILAGDLCSAWARSLLLNAVDERHGATFTAEALLEAQRVYVSFEAEVVLGQMLDVLGADGVGDVEDLEDLKTGSYTVRGPLRLGAALAGAPAALQEGLTAFATPLGRAFQIRDDLLGAFGDPARTGKGVGRDLRAGKRTWLVARALASAAVVDRDVLAAVLGRADASDDEVARALAVLRDGGARADAEARVAALSAEAHRALEGLSGVTAQGREMLEELVGSLAQRDT